MTTPLTVQRVPSSDSRLRAFTEKVGNLLNGLINTDVVFQTTNQWILAPWIYVSGTTTTTTNATPKTIATVPMAANRTYLIEVTVTGRRTGGSSGTVYDSAVYIRRAKVNGADGVTATISAVTSEYTVEDQAGWDVGLSASGSNVIVQVTGAVDNNITWSCYVRLLSADLIPSQLTAVKV